MEQIRHKAGNLLAICFGFYLFLLILRRTNVKNSFHDTGAYQLSAQHKLVLVSVVWDHAVSAQ